MRGFFITKRLKTEDLDGENAQLLEPCIFWSQELQNTLYAPRGFITDFASIPRPLYILPMMGFLFPKRGKHDRAAVIHDAGYRHELRDAVGNRIVLTKSQSDDLFDECLRDCKINWFTRRWMVRAVRVAGDPQSRKQYEEQLNGTHAFVG